MDLRGQEIKNTYGNVVTVGSSAGAPTTGELTNGQNTSFTSTYLGGNFGIGSAPTAYGSLNVLGIGSAASAAGAIIDIVGTSGRLASIYTEASGKLVLTADPTNAQAGTALEFNVDGTNAMFIDSSQNVGIGTVSPAQKLEVSGTVSAYRFISTSSTASLPSYAVSSGNGMYLAGVNTIGFSTFSTERMRIDSVGYVGIGTSSPVYNLHINAATDSRIIITDSVQGSTANDGMYIRQSGVNASIVNQENGTLQFGTNNSFVQTITAAGNVGIGTSSPNIGTWNRALTLNTASGNTACELAVGGAAQLYLAADSSNAYLQVANATSPLRIFTGAAERMRITSAGDVGIGTATPETKLDVDGDIQTAAPETSTNAAWKLGNVGLGGVFVGAADYVTVSVGGLVVKLPIAIFPETQDYYDRVIADGGTFEGLLGYESAVTILKAE